MCPKDNALYLKTSNIAESKYQPFTQTQFIYKGSKKLNTHLLYYFNFSKRLLAMARQPSIFSKKGPLENFLGTLNTPTAISKLYCVLQNTL